jgi:hypothetical protein
MLDAQPIELLRENLVIGVDAARSEVNERRGSAKYVDFYNGNRGTVGFKITLRK